MPSSRTRRLFCAFLSLFALGALAPLAAAAPAGGHAAGCATPGRLSTIAYRSLPGVDKKFTSLDIHAPAGQVCNAPVVIWVHGGGYAHGDKADAMKYKVPLFNSRGWLLVSVNYRLTNTKDPNNPNSAHYPDHYNDVAAAVGWVNKNIGKYGGDPAQVALLGHSAGADIVSNVADRPLYLNRFGVGPADLRCAGPLDTEGFDKPRADLGEQQQWRDALGNLDGYQQKTSATLFAKAGTHIPATIGVYRGALTRQSIEKSYLRKLSDLQVTTATINAVGLSHEEVNRTIGAPNGQQMTVPLMKFLTSCFTR